MSLVVRSLIPNCKFGLYFRDENKFNNIFFLINYTEMSEKYDNRNSIFGQTLAKCILLQRLQLTRVLEFRINFREYRRAIKNEQIQRHWQRDKEKQNNLYERD